MNTKIERYEQLRIDILAAEAEMKARWHAWVADQVATPAVTRAALESRHAAMKLERARLQPEVEALKAHARRAKNAKFLRLIIVLVESCERAGHGDLVSEAKAAGREWLEVQGLAETYAARA